MAAILVRATVTVRFFAEGQHSTRLTPQTCFFVRLAARTRCLMWHNRILYLLPNHDLVCSLHMLLLAFKVLFLLLENFETGRANSS
jgi:hypothetical protein